MWIWITDLFLSGYNYNWLIFICISTFCTGKSVWEALILESVNPSYDNRLFIQLRKKYKLSTCCVHKIVSNVKKKCVCNMRWACIFLVIQWTIWCHTPGFSDLPTALIGQIHARIWASDKDLPVWTRSPVPTIFS